MDKEPSFVSAVANSFYSLLGIVKGTTVSNKALGDGQSEAYVKVVSKVMAALFAVDRLDGQTDHNWKARIPYVSMAINSLPSTTTGFSPWFIATGRELILPSNLTLSLPRERTNVPEAIRALWSTCQSTYDVVLRNSGLQLAKDKKRYDAHNVVTHDEYNVGDLVLYRKFALGVRDPKSFMSAFEAQIYIVVKRIGANYFIRPTNRPDLPKNHKVVHFNQIRPYIQRDEGTDRDRDKRIATRPARLGFEMNKADENAIH